MNSLSTYAKVSLAAWLAFSISARAGGSYDGVYIGGFDGPRTGAMGMIVTDRTAVLAFADETTGAGAIVERIPVANDGTFRFYNRAAGGRVTGRLTDGGLIGSFTSGGSAGEFSAGRVDDGARPELEGYYTGRLEARSLRAGSGNVRGRMIAMIDGDGVGFALLHGQTARERQAPPPADGFPWTGGFPGPGDFPGAGGVPGPGWNPFEPDLDGPNWSPFGGLFTGLIGLFDQFGSTTRGTTTGGLIAFDAEGFAPVVLPQGVRISGEADASGGFSGTLWVRSSAFSGNGAWSLTRERLPASTTGPRIPTLPDLDGDGHDEIVWRNTLTGEHRSWSQRPGSSSSQSVPAVPNATIAAAGDFDGDGNDELLWRESSGALVVQYRDGFEFPEEVLTADPGSMPNTAVGLGGYEDAVLLRDEQSGAYAVVTRGGTPEAYPGDIGPRDHVLGAADFDRDGRDDLVVYRVQDSSLEILFHRGGSARPLRGSASPTASFGIGDVDADGDPDIASHDTASGTVTVWFMAGAHARSSRTFSNAIGVRFQIAAIGDVYARGRDGLIVRDLESGRNQWIGLAGDSIETIELRPMPNMDWVVVPM